MPSTFFGSASDRKAVQLGRAHHRRAEIHYQSGQDMFWYHGELWTSETRPVRGEEIDPELTDPRNAEIFRLMESGKSDELIARHLLSIPGAVAPVRPGGDPALRERRALQVVRRLRFAREHASDPHEVRFYGFRQAGKGDERVFATVDQDLLEVSPSVPYTRTEKGAKRVQLITLVGMGAADVIFLIGILLFASAPVATGQAAAQVGADVASQAIIFGLTVACVFIFLGTYLWMARRTEVLDVVIQPVRETILDTHTELVFSTNSTKVPVSAYMSHLLRTDSSGIDKLASAVRDFQADTISVMRDQIASLRSQLDSAKIGELDTINEGLDLRAFGHGTAPSLHQDRAAMWIIVCIVAVVVGAGVWAAMAAGA